MQLRSYNKPKPHSKPLTPKLFGHFDQEEMALIAAKATIRMQLPPSHVQNIERDLESERLDAAYYLSLKEQRYEHLNPSERRELDLNPMEVAKQGQPLPLVIKQFLDWVNYDNQYDLLCAFWQVYRGTRYKIGEHNQALIEKKVITFWENKRRLYKPVQEQPFKQTFKRVSDLSAGGNSLMTLWREFVLLFLETKERTKAPAGFREVCAQFLKERGDNDYNRMMLQMLAAPLRNRLYQQGQRGRFGAVTPLLESSESLLFEEDEDSGSLVPSAQEVRRFERCHRVFQLTSHDKLERVGGQRVWTTSQVPRTIDSLTLEDQAGNQYPYPCFATSPRFEAAVRNLVPYELEDEQDYGTTVEQVAKDQANMWQELEDVCSRDYDNDVRTLSPYALFSVLQGKLLKLSESKIRNDRAAELAKLEAKLQDGVKTPIQTTLPYIQTPIAAERNPLPYFKVPISGKKNPTGVKVLPPTHEESKKAEAIPSQEEQKATAPQEKVSPNKRQRKETQEAYEMIKKGMGNNNKRARQ